MKVMELTAWDLASLQPGTRPDPVPGPGEVLIRMAAASINYRDGVIAQRGYGRLSGLNAAATLARYVPIDAGVVPARQDQADVFLAAGVVSRKVDASQEFDDRLNPAIVDTPEAAASRNADVR